VDDVAFLRKFFSVTKKESENTDNQSSKRNKTPLKTKDRPLHLRAVQFKDFIFNLFP